MGENRVKQFRDKTMSCIRVRSGSNQKEEPYLGENVLPFLDIHLENESWIYLIRQKICIAESSKRRNKLFGNVFISITRQLSI